MRFVTVRCDTSSTTQGRRSGGRTHATVGASPGTAQGAAALHSCPSVSWNAHTRSFVATSSWCHTASPTERHTQEQRAAKPAALAPRLLEQLWELTFCTHLNCGHSKQRGALTHVPHAQAPPTCAVHWAQQHRLPGATHGRAQAHAPGPGAAAALKTHGYCHETKREPNVGPCAPPGRHCGAATQRGAGDQPPQRTNPWIPRPSGQVHTRVMRPRIARVIDTLCAQCSCLSAPQACDMCPLRLAAQPDANPYWLPTPR